MSELASEPSSVALLPSRPQRKDRVFFALWVVVTTISPAIAEPIVNALSENVVQPFGEWLTHFVVALFLIELSKADFSLIMALAKYSLTGLAGGFLGAIIISSAQWLVMRLRMKGMFGWVLVSVGVSAIVGTMSGFVSVLLVEVQLSWIYVIVYWFLIDAPVSGLLFGTGQWLVLRNKLRNSAIWILTPWVIQAVQRAIEIPWSLIGLPIIGNWSDGLLQWIVGVLFNLGSKLFYAVATGAILVWLISKDLRYAKFVEEG